MNILRFPCFCLPELGGSTAHALFPVVSQHILSHLLDLPPVPLLSLAPCAMSLLYAPPISKLPTKLVLFLFLSHPWPKQFLAQWLVLSMLMFPSSPGQIILDGSFFCLNCFVCSYCSLQAGSLNPSEVFISGTVLTFTFSSELPHTITTSGYSCS